MNHFSFNCFLYLFIPFITINCHLTNVQRVSMMKHDVTIKSPFVHHDFDLIKPTLLTKIKIIVSIYNQNIIIIITIK